ncbi:hypothetical protein L7F22_023755 [Adiantum nelumboides]|nr:hypothetical protein [Adiantum nelumboides]
MNAQTVLDHVVFQLTPTRTRYELFVVSRGATERMTSGLLKPFLLHLQAAEEQLSKGGYSIKLEPPAQIKAPWFTKGTVERFVRFVSSPLVIERGNTIEMELIQLEETLKMQNLASARAEDPLLDESSSICLLGEKNSSPYGKPRLLKKMRQNSVENDSGVATNSKKQLLRALEARRLVLQKEQGMAFARAAAAGFELVPLLQLIMFSECFGAERLRDACCRFVALCKKRQISGFCIGDLSLVDQDISWALSNSACVSILKSMEKGAALKDRREEINTVPSKQIADLSAQKVQKNFDGSIRSEKSDLRIQYEQQLSFSHPSVNPAGQFCDWSNSAAVYQGWPAMYTDRNGLCATSNGYYYGYSPGSQQSYTTLSDMSPSATGFFCYSAGVTNQQPFDVHANCQTSSSQDLSAFPSLKKLQLGHRGKKKGRMATQDVKSDESFTHGYEKDSSSDMTDSSLERLDSSKAASVAFKDDYALKDFVKDGLEQGVTTTAGCRKNWMKIAELDPGFIRRIDTSEDPLSFRGDASLSLIQTNDASCQDSTFALHQDYDTTSDFQKSLRKVSDDNAVILFEQNRDSSVGSRSKKRLDFQEPEIDRIKQNPGESKVIDDSIFACTALVACEHRIKQAIESELQNHQIYDKMSKQALRVNSLVSTRHEPDDLLMLPRRQKRHSSSTSSDVLNIDAELHGVAGCASLSKSQKSINGVEPSQERVKNFLNHYNEQREAKLRGNASSSKRAESRGKLKAMKEDLEKRKSELVKATRPERARLQTEAQLRADKLRMYKADLLKNKKEKEEEERRRLEELKAERQSRIAARSNLAGRSNANISNASGSMSAQPSNLKPSPAASRLSALQKGRTVLRGSQDSTSSTPITRCFRERPLRPLSSSPKDAACQKLRSTTPFVSRQSSIPFVSRQTGKARVGSQSSSKVETLKSPRRTTSPPIKTKHAFSAFLNKNDQMARPSLVGKKENSTILSKKQGLRPGSYSGSLADRSKKGLPSKEMLKGVEESMREGRTFLKKGSGGGAGALTRNIQKSKPTSPHTAMTMDKRPLFMAGTLASKLDSKQENGVKKSGEEHKVAFPTTIPTIVKHLPSTASVSSQGIHFSSL